MAGKIQVSGGKVRHPNVPIVTDEKPDDFVVPVSPKAVIVPRGGGKINASLSPYEESPSPKKKEHRKKKDDKRIDALVDSANGARELVKKMQKVYRYLEDDSDLIPTIESMMMALLSYRTQVTQIVAEDDSEGEKLPKKRKIHQ